MERWREGARRTQRMNRAEVRRIDPARLSRGRPLEGPAADMRLDVLKAALAEASSPRKGEVHPLVLSAVVFLTILIGGLAWPYLTRWLGR